MQTTKKRFLILNFGIFISISLRTPLATSSNDRFQDPDSSGDYVKVEKVLGLWDPYTDFIAGQSLKNARNKKPDIVYYPARGKKFPIEDADTEKLNELSYVYIDRKQKKSIGFVPVRGRKPVNFKPSRGRKDIVFIPMRGKKDEQSSEAEDSLRKNAVDVENGTTPTRRHPEDSGDLRDMELTLTQEMGKGDENTFTDGNRGMSFLRMKGKIGLFPFIN